MRVLLVYFSINTGKQDKYHYGLGYIGSVLKENGHDVDYIVLKGKRSISRLYSKVIQDPPDILGISITTSQQVYLKYVMNALRTMYKGFIICGGVHPTLKPECIYEIPGLDAIVRGEGEFPLLELVEAFEGNRDYLKIKNIWYRAKGTIIQNELRPSLKNLDKLPFPDKKSWQYQKWINENNSLNRFLFSRGCKFSCTYCVNQALRELNGGGYHRLRSPEMAIGEIEQGSKRFRFKRITFDDDTINLDKEWFYEFLNLYRHNFQYPFACNVRLDIIDEDMIKLMKDAGATTVYLGVEQGNEKFRKEVLKRNISNDQIIGKFKLFARYGIKCKAQVMVGLPLENRTLFLDTVRLCRRLPLKANNPINIYYPYPSTELGKLCERKGWLPEKEYVVERKEATISYPDFHRKEIQLCRDAFPAMLKFKKIPLTFPIRLFTYLSIMVLPRRVVGRILRQVINRLLILNLRKKSSSRHRTVRGGL